MFVHDPSSEQLSVPNAHSSSSAHVTPSPEYPESHEQSKPPIVFEHEALSEQLSVPNAHSSLSEHEIPSPEYPEGHAAHDVTVSHIVVLSKQSTN